MRAKVLSTVAAVATTLAQFTSAVSQVGDSKLQARQSINFDLVDSAPDPAVRPDDIPKVDPAVAIASVIAEVKAGAPLSQRKRALAARDIIVSTYPGYTENIPLGNAAINAPLDCNQKDTYMGVKLFTKSTFDTSLCAAACSAQSEYNIAHPPLDRPAQICRFYNTYALYKNDVYEGQYCALYSQTWAVTYATNTGQWRGNDHYTIRSSYVASNATDPGICLPVVTTTMVTTTSTAAPVPECATRPTNLCCMGVAPWSTNSYVWGGICGYTPEDPSELIGARCVPRPTSGNCPSGSSAACCRGTVSGQCALGTQCARS